MAAVLGQRLGGGDAGGPRPCGLKRLGNPAAGLVQAGEELDRPVALGDLGKLCAKSTRSGSMMQTTGPRASPPALVRSIAAISSTCSLLRFDRDADVSRILPKAATLASISSCVTLRKSSWLNSPCATISTVRSTREISMNIGMHTPPTGRCGRSLARASKAGDAIRYPHRRCGKRAPSHSLCVSSPQRQALAFRALFPAISCASRDIPLDGEE